MQSRWTEARRPFVFRSVQEGVVGEFGVSEFWLWRVALATSSALALPCGGHEVAGIQCVGFVGRRDVLFRWRAQPRLRVVAQVERLHRLSDGARLVDVPGHRGVEIELRGARGGSRRAVGQVVLHGGCRRDCFGRCWLERGFNGRICGAGSDGGCVRRKGFACGGEHAGPNGGGLLPLLFRRGGWHRCGRRCGWRRRWWRGC